MIIISTTDYEFDVRRDIADMQIDADVRACREVLCDSWGDYGEDVIVEKILSSVGIKEFAYLDIGIPYPIDGSNTYRFYHRGWNGACVEANPDAIPRLELIRNKNKIIHCGVCGTEENGKELTFYRFKKDGWNTFDEEVAKYRVNTYGFEIEESVEVPMRTLNSIIEDELDFIPDYISLDVECYEYKILRDFDFDKYQVKVFCIEKSGQEVFDLMIEKGYVLSAQTPSNWIFVLGEVGKRLWEF